MVGVSIPMIQWDVEVHPLIPFHEATCLLEYGEQRLIDLCDSY